MIINRQNLTRLFQGFQAIYVKGFAAGVPLMSQVAMTVNSTGSSETYGWLGQTTGFREWIGDRVIQSLGLHDYAIKNRKFENTVGVGRDLIDDDTYGILSPLFEQLGQDAKLHPDELIFALLAAGFTTPCYDGQYFFDTDHPVKKRDGSTVSVSNFQGGSGTPWYLIDDTRVIKPLIFQKRRDYKFVAKDRLEDDNVFEREEYLYGVDARGNAGFGLWQLAFASKEDLDLTSLADARAQQQSIKGDNERPLNIRSSLLVVPPALEHAALQIANAEMINNTTNVYRGTVKVLVVPALA